MHKKDLQLVDLQTSGLSETCAQSATAAKGYICIIEAQVHVAVTGPKTAQLDTAQHAQEAGCPQSGQPL